MNIQHLTESKNAHGYVMDMPYTWGFFKYQSPILLSYAARLKGHNAPDPAKPFVHCDLGCGNGVTTNLLAAAYPHAEFYGVDINSEHIDNARALAEKSGLKNATFIDASFDEIGRYNLPKFDYITMHGVYSWVGAEVRNQIHDVIDSLLGPDGLVYLCYNTLPGASNLIPLWKMMQAYSADLDSDLATNAKAALKSITEMRDNNSQFFRDTPLASKFLDKLIKRDARYLVHEFSNACYEPQYFWDVAKNFQMLGLEFAGSAKLHRNNEKNLLSSRHDSHLNQANSEMDRESRASFIRNESFRWDIFIRSQSAPETARSTNMMGDMYIGALQAPDDLNGTVKIGRRAINLDGGLFRKLIDVASAGTLRLGEIIMHQELRDYSPPDITQAIHDLIAANCLHPFMAPALSQSLHKGTVLRISDPVNLALIKDRLLSEGKTYLTSSISGSAVRLVFVDSLLVETCHDNKLQDLKARFEKRLRDINPRVLHKYVSKADAGSQKWVDRKIRYFTNHYLPRLLRLGILVTK